MIVAQEYSDFVRARFKFLQTAGSGEYYTSAASLLHAAIGLTGEVAELLVARSREHSAEELGDFEFYLEAAKIVTFFDNRLDDCRVEFVDDKCEEPVSEVAFGQWGTHGLLMLAHQFQDVAKKEWAYTKPRNNLVLWTLIGVMEDQLIALYAFLGLSRDDILVQNIGKLLKRFPEGYTDAAAQARADKEVVVEEPAPLYHPLTAATLSELGFDKTPVLPSDNDLPDGEV